MTQIDGETLVYDRARDAASCLNALAARFGGRATARRPSPRYAPTSCQIEAERVAAPSCGGAGAEVCRMHGAGGGAPKGIENALEHRETTARALALNKEIAVLARMARETMAAIE